MSSVPTNGAARTGVFLCACGGNISDVVDAQRVASEAASLPGVVYASTQTFCCSEPGQKTIEQAIRDHRLNRVVVAACSPSLHEATFRKALARAGLNPYLYEHCNVREQVSWVIEDRELATRKAGRLVRAAVARAALLEPLQRRRIVIHPSALVIGGGIAGLTAARDLAARNIEVTLIESGPFLGGRLAQLHRIYPTGQLAHDILAGLIRQVSTHPKVKIYTNAQLWSASGFVGDFRTMIRLVARGVNEQLQDPEAAIDACPEEAVDQFNLGLAKRKAIYRTYDG